LEELDIDGTETNGKGKNESMRAEKENTAPTTPERRSTTCPMRCEEISPIDTSFSGHSIFDTPVRRNVHSGSPTRGCPDRDDSSDVTSVGDDDDWGSLPKKEQLLQPPAAPDFAQCRSLPPASVNSYDPPSVNEEEEETEVIANPLPIAGFPPYDPNESRLVWITSCLQCTLANLPCSRTHPACSRCKRKGVGDECLLHRRSFAIEALDLEKCKVPILLKVRGRDEEVWQQNVKLAEELRVKWAAGQEKKNWVMPDIGSPRATLKEKIQVLQGWRIKKEELHPGEGMGKMSYKELIVDMDA
jgi:hypothetical protein